MTTLALLTTALLFGGMVLYSFGFAAFLFTHLSAEVAGPTLRKAFPFFYLFVIASAGLAALLSLGHDLLSAALLALIALSTVPTRQILMPAINAATDAGNKARFDRLHYLSVAITLVHIALTAWVLARFL
ncbi:MAG: DUF4149 domain-containing protein [Pseudomonadota bacterium]